MRSCEQLQRSRGWMHKRNTASNRKLFSWCNMKYISLSQKTPNKPHLTSLHQYLSIDPSKHFCYCNTHIHTPQLWKILCHESTVCISRILYFSDCVFLCIPVSVTEAWDFSGNEQFPRRSVASVLPWEDHPIPWRTWRAPALRAAADRWLLTAAL